VEALRHQKQLQNIWIHQTLKRTGTVSCGQSHYQR